MPSRWPRRARTCHHRLPEGANHRPVQLGASMQVGALGLTVVNHPPAPADLATKALAYESPG